MRRFYIFYIITLIFTISLFAQQRNHVKPDLLNPITIDGTVTVDTTDNRAKYFLESDGDFTLDYVLNFGPYWYQPDSSDATRPQDGDIITIFGGICDGSNNMADDLPVIIVYEIDGMFWRDPFAPYWNHFLGKGKGNSYGYQNHRGYACGWLTDSLQHTEISGSIMIDSTFNYWHYYLNSDSDSLPEYYLNFGPPWYEPESGLEKPADGELVTIYGALKNCDSFSVIIVLQLNGEEWRDSSGFNGKELGGQWISRTMNQHRFIHTPFDTASGMQVRTGWNGNDAAGLPDSVFCQVLQLFPDNVPNSQNQNAFAAFETAVFNRNRMNMMTRNDSTGGKLQFSSTVRFQFHYIDIQAQGYNVNESTIQLKTWNSDSKSWQAIPDVNVDTENNLISYESSTISGLTILTANENITSLVEKTRTLPAEFELQQNFPNPFNPMTHIKFILKEDARIVLTVYNVLGQKEIELINGKLQAGDHEVAFMAENLTSGIYFCELKSQDVRQIIKMTVIK